MRLPFRFWKSFFASLGQLRQARRRANEARKKRRSLRRRPELTTFEPRVVMNADPIAMDDDLATTMDQAIAFSEDQLTANDSDPDGDSLAVVGLHGRPQHGSIQWGNDGTLLYTPESGFSGVESIDYILSDGHDHEVRGTINIQVNDPGPANNGFTLVQTERTVHLEVGEYWDLAPMSLIDSDPDGDVYYQPIALPDIGVFHEDGMGNITFQSDVEGTTTAQIEFSDGEYSQIWTVTFEITVPVGGEENGGGGEEPNELTLLSYADEQVLSANGEYTFRPDENVAWATESYTFSIGDPTFGTVTDNGDGSYTYAPDGQSGTATLIVSYEDQGVSREQAITFTVLPVAVAQNDEYTLYVPYGSSNATFFLSQFPPQLDNDLDPVGGGLTLIDPDFTIDDPEILVGIDDSYQYNYTVVDANGNTSSGTVTIYVYETPNSDFSLTETERSVAVENSGSWAISVWDLVADDADGDLSYQVVQGTDFGTLDDDGAGLLTFTPTGMTGATSAVVRFSDGEYVHDWTVTFDVYEDEEDGGDEEPNPFTLASYEDAQTIAANGSYTFRPEDNIVLSSGSHTSSLGEPSFGTVTYDGDGWYTYTPDGQSGTATLTVYYEDQGIYLEQTITFTVLPMPIANDDVHTLYVPRGSMEAMVFLSQFPPQLDNDLDPAGGGLTLVDPDFSVSDPEILIGVNESYQYGYTVADANGDTSSGTVTIYVYEAPNQVPVAGPDEYDVTVPHGAAGMTIDLFAFPPSVDNDTDGDGDPLLAETNITEDNRYVWIEAGSSYTYEYSVSDEFGGWSVGEVTIRATAANADPQAVDDAYVVSMNGALSVAAAQGLLANDTDSDNDPLAIVYDVVNMSTAQGGLVSIAADGSFTYTPAADFVGTDSFAYTVSDGFGGSSTAAAFIVVEEPLPVNQTPTFTAGGDVSVQTDAAQVVLAGWASNIAAGPEDESWQTTSFTVAVDRPDLFDAEGLPQLVLNTETGDYDLVFTPAAGAVGAATLTLRLRDDGGTANGGDDEADPVVRTIAITPFGGDPDTGGAVLASAAAVTRVGLARTSIERKEGENGNVLLLTVVLSQPATTEIEVDWSAETGTAYAGVDFASLHGTLSFGIGEAQKTIEIPLIDDDLDRGDDRAFQVVLTGAIGAEVVEEYAAATVLLAENDATATIYAVTPDGIEGGDGSGGPNQLQFVVELSRELDHDVTIQYTINGPGAGDVADAGTGSITFHAGETSQTISLDVLDDDAWTEDPNDPNVRRGEPTKAVIVQLGDPPAGVMFGTAAATALLVDDDWQEFQYTGNLEPVQSWFDPSEYEVDSVIYLPPELIAENEGITEFTVPENWSGQWFWIFADEMDWVDIEPRDPLPVASVTWIDSEPVSETDGATVKFRISMSGITYGGGDPVTVYYTTRGITAVAGEDFAELTGSVTFTEDGYQDVEITLNASDLVEPQERFALAITDVSGGIVGDLEAVAQVKADARVLKVTFTQTGSTGELRFDRGTYRFFPDAKFVGGQLQSGPTNTVRVRAEVEGMKAGDLVYFAAFDIDDPTFFGSQWDNDIGIAGRRGFDNLGKIDPNDPYAPIDVETSTTLGFSGLLRDSDAPNNAPWTAPANGRNFPIQSAKVYYDNVGLVYYAEVDLLTSFQPGDNFRVVALPQKQANNNPGTIPTYVEDAFQALDFADESINAQPAAESGMSATRVLTVWRKLFVELDVMETAEGQAGDQVAAQVVSVNAAVVTLNNVVGTVTANSLAGGVLQIGVGQQATYYAITGNSIVDAATGTMTVTVNLASEQGATVGALGALAAGDAVLLHDDDKRVAAVDGMYSIVPKIDPASSEVRDAVRSYLQGGVNQQTNRFAGAFIEADFTTLASLQSTIAFEAHSTPTDGDDPLFGGQSYRGSTALESDPRFWVSYLAVAYQTGDPGPSVQYGASIPDADWDTGYALDAISSGEEPAIAVEWSVLYIENLRDIWQQVVNTGTIGGGAYVPRELLAQIAFTAAQQIGKQLDIAALESNPEATQGGINDETPNLMSSRQLVYTNSLSALTLLPQDAIFLRRNFKAGPRRQ